MVEARCFLSLTLPSVMRCSFLPCLLLPLCFFGATLDNVDAATLAVTGAVGVVIQVVSGVSSLDIQVRYASQ